MLFPQQDLNGVEVRSLARLFAPAALHQDSELLAVTMEAEGRTEGGDATLKHHLNNLCGGGGSHRYIIFKNYCLPQHSYFMKLHTTSQHPVMTMIIQKGYSFYFISVTIHAHSLFLLPPQTWLMFHTELFTLYFCFDVLICDQFSDWSAHVPLQLLTRGQFTQAHMIQLLHPAFLLQMFVAVEPSGLFCLW